MNYPRITSLEELKVFKDKTIKELEAYKVRIYVCMTGCRALGSGSLTERFKAKLKEEELEKDVLIIETGCHGKCSNAPLILLEPFGYLYGDLKPEDADEIIAETIIKGNKIDRFFVGSNKEEGAGFFGLQRKDVLKDCGKVDPQRIEDAVASGSYGMIGKILTTYSPEKVIEEVLESGLKGRGGAGFPTGRKWDFCRRAPGDEKYLICNADEGDPGAFMDRALLEGSPHQVIEGMLIAAYAIGASNGFMYVRAEYPIAVDHINMAIKQAHACGLLGDNIFGTDFCFDLKVRKGAGAFVCGEETALIASLEGKRGMPTSRPPFPANSGYKGKPTNINNVETFANIPVIMEKGGSAFSSVGTESSKGTKIFALAGKVKNTGLVEVPIGITLREIIFDIGDGIPKDKKFKAAQMGGPSGGCVPAEYLDLPVDYDSLKEVGAIMGSGGLIVMDEDTCMVDVAHYFLKFTQAESCGKCVPCRVGTRHMADILKRIRDGNGEDGDIQKLEELGKTIQKTSLCALGQTAPNPVLTTIRYFRDEYETHINDKSCPAGVCKELITYSIEADKCTGCGRCKKSCAANAISGEKKEPHKIDSSKCIKCGLCFDVCNFDAVIIK